MTQDKLSRGTLYLMATGTGLVVANNYYNQPLLGLMARDLGISESAVSVVPMLTQLGYAAGLLFIVPSGDMFKRKKLILNDFAFILLALVALATAKTVALDGESELRPRKRCGRCLWARRSGGGHPGKLGWPLNRSNEQRSNHHYGS